ncbi:GNAT family N-acetyltransferase [Nitrincola alkalilacustris]|uniref:GNAT family N-acetyltransferase n=1 Tax=Nitrincola alkalilacustris TaxID=1571224 RepID=UPI001F0DFED4|nr:GNAT family N-acetyltransferase [Nitrincola alkalilacustris]
MMIRPFNLADMDQVLQVWLDASVLAHDFVDGEFWASRIEDMRHIYLPLSEIYVYEENGIIQGFLSLQDDTLAALFIRPEYQGRGIGFQLMEMAKEERERLDLAVYKCNWRSVDFYERCGFQPVREQTDQHTGQTEVVMTWYLEQAA